MIQPPFPNNGTWHLIAFIYSNLFLNNFYTSWTLQGHPFSKAELNSHLTETIKKEQVVHNKNNSSITDNNKTIIPKSIPIILLESKPQLMKKIAQRSCDSTKAWKKDETEMKCEEKEIRNRITEKGGNWLNSNADWFWLYILQGQNDRMLI